MRRTSGVLLHPTSLPGPHGIGDLGDAAFRFVDFLHQAGQGLWQMLPLGPTGYGDSPYQLFSAFAGNPLLISLEKLQQDGWLSATDLADYPQLDDCQVDFGRVIPLKLERLQQAHRRFRDTASANQREDFSRFCTEQAEWLADYALFRALKDAHEGRPWDTWEEALIQRDPVTLAKYRQQLAEAIEWHSFMQFLFDRQWHALRAYAHRRQVKLVGDMPIFVAHDSADVWAHQQRFQMDKQGRCTVVAGVPPDYFSADGQLWGNPLYRWDTLAAEGYRFWLERIRRQLAMVDVIRLDHFRGFAAYWEVPGDALNARQGRWVPAPGLELFQTLRQELGGLPLIAEDLGEITEDVYALRDELELPGMAVLQFGFAPDDPGSPHKPHNFRPAQVVYTGTHDNDTTLGWWQQQPTPIREHLCRYLACEAEAMPQALIRSAWASVATMALVPMQDLLALGSEARLNTPGQAGGNWAWRYREADLSMELAEGLRNLSVCYERFPL